MKLSVKELPDRFSIDGGANYINYTEGGIDPSTAMNGDWEWDNINDEIRFIGNFSHYFLHRYMKSTRKHNARNVSLFCKYCLKLHCFIV